MDTNLVIYCGVTLLILYTLAEQIAPGPRVSVIDGCRLGYVYDGDTVELMCPDRKRTARLVGFDTPETKNPGCAAEKALGDRATARLRQIVGGASISFQHKGHDKYGRELVRMFANGRDVGQVLIGEGLAVRYYGGSRINWCKRLNR
ncbi:thermonuclease family protein [Aliiroseovarius sp. S1123]|jgi:endonuclease YncB( thermonuclease family)|uniref:thermonuclease family protein n=1 Tax=unclassified Aliiroseovarius TaxID=2623558 RepID=UPI001FF2986F|nr:thermonuclease family protein [Aliiroseovarius sp. S1123]MCK0170006.1 thermonuclease family protein [Aliiroseovarius sp. S1123]